MNRFNRGILVLLLLFAMTGSVSGKEPAFQEELGEPASHLSSSQGVTTLVSVASDWTQGNAHSGPNSISADGRYVVFWSMADNLVPSDTNESQDIFVHNSATGQTERVSVASDGTQGTGGGSGGGSISADGRYVAFYSYFTNLVTDDTNGVPDVFVHDRLTGQTERVSVSSDGAQGDGTSRSNAISADGRYVMFTSAASNLVTGDTNELEDVFVHDRLTGQTERVSVSSDGVQGTGGKSAGGSISADGRYVAFTSAASNLVPGDTNGWYDVFAHDRMTGLTERISVATDGSQGDIYSSDASISADGRYVAFSSRATNLVPGDTDIKDIFVRDRVAGQTQRVSVSSEGTQGDDDSYNPSISADGRYVVFSSWATNLVIGDTNTARDIFVHDRWTGQTERVSVASDGTQANAGWTFAEKGFISAGGRYVAFGSAATNLACSDTNLYEDVFVRDREGIADNIISGSVREANGTPVNGVTVSANTGISDLTGIDGDYSLTLDACGIYTVTPTLADYAFWPSHRTVSVPPAATGQDFAMLAPPVSAMLSPLAPGVLTYTDTQGLPTTLSFPAGAVDETTTVTLTPTVASGDAKLAFAGHAFDLESYQSGVQQPGFAFNLPVTVTIEYSEIDVGSVSEESELSLQWWTGVEWEEAANTCDPPSVYVRDLEGRIISLPICHLSKFVLFGPTRSIYLPLVAKGG